MTATAERAPVVEEDERDLLVDALVAAQDQVAALVSLLAVPDDSLDHDVLVERVLDRCADLVEADVVLLRRGGRGDQEVLSARAARHGGEVRRLLAAAADGRPGTGSGADGSWAVISFPRHHGGVTVLRLGGGAFTTGDLRLLETVAAAVEQLLRWADLHAEVLRQATLEREHQTASTLAQAVLQTELPLAPGLALTAECRPAALTGGDFWVVEKVGDAVWFAVGDVAGKGLPAAMIMIQAVNAVRTAIFTAAADDPAGALAAVTAQLRPYLGSVGSFVTLALGVHVPGRGTVRLANAGHSPVAHRPAGAATAVAVPASVPPVGVEVDLAPVTVELDFPPGSALLIGTDGLVEQPDPEGRLLGYDHFLDLCGQGPVADLGPRLLAEVDRHASGEPATDDRTLVVLAAQEVAPRA